jgi:hypothetical protein
MNDLPQVKEEYRVEISGWNASDTFFVEKATLEWGRESQKTISLFSSLREGCVVFVRLLSSYANERYFHTAYQALNVEERLPDGRIRASLVPVRPRALINETARELEESSGQPPLLCMPF